MKVIADLYGAGNPSNKHARREFREIKESVMADVRSKSSLKVQLSLIISLVL